MINVVFERSFFGEDVVAAETLVGDEWRLRAFLVITTLIAGAWVVAAVWKTNSSVRWLLICASAAGTWHYADNIAWPAKHCEPKWLYTALLFSPMDQTWLFQFVMHALTVKAAELAALKRAATKPTLRVLMVLVGAAHMITLGHFFVDGMSSFTVDAWLSIVVESGLGLAVLWAANKNIKG